MTLQACPTGNNWAWKKKKECFKKKEKSNVLKLLLTTQVSRYKPPTIPDSSLNLVNHFTEGILYFLLLLLMMHALNCQLYIYWLFNCQQVLILYNVILREPSWWWFMKNKLFILLCVSRRFIFYCSTNWGKMMLSWWNNKINLTLIKK